MAVDSLSTQVDPLDPLALLARQFPQAFTIGHQRWPLKIGIHEDLVARATGLSNNQILKALHRYTSDISYLRVMVEGAARVDLDGNSAGTVTARQAAFAKKQMKATESGNQVERTEQPRRSSLADLRAAAHARRVGGALGS
jgi:ProP effector